MKSPSKRRSFVTRRNGIGLLGVAFVFLAGCTSFRDYVHNGFKVGPTYKKPPAPVENWREKRRAERAFKKARAAEVEESPEADDDNEPVDEEAPSAAHELEGVGQEPPSTDVDSDDLPDEGAEGDEGEPPSGESPIGRESAPATVTGQSAVAAVAGTRRSRRRRRRKGRRPGDPQANATLPAAPNGGLDPPAPPKEPSNEG